jgi:CPA2 family monovalent cation:H+ antiporter-2
VALVLAAPFLVGLVRNTRVLGAMLAESVLPRAETGRADTAEAPRRALRAALQIIVALGVGAPMLALVQPFFPSYVGPALLGLVLAVLGVGFWKSAENLQGHVRAGAGAVAELLARHGGRRRDLEQVHHLMPGLGDLAPLRLSPDSPAAGKTLAQVNLRGLTGATVLSIRRGERNLALPSGHDVLQAGDLLGLSGSLESLAKARELLSP